MEKDLAEFTSQMLPVLPKKAPLLAAGASTTLPKQGGFLGGIHPLPTSPVALAVTQGW